MGKNRKFATVVVALIGAAIVYGLYRFNYGPLSGNYGMYMLVNLMALFFVPMLTIFLVFREEPAAFGFVNGASKRTWGFVGVLFAGCIVLMVFAARLPGFQNYYPIFRRFYEFQSVFAYPKYPQENPFLSAPWTMLYAELSYGMYLFCWEFFFRGYLLFGLQRSLGWFAVIVQAVAFGLLHMGKPEMIPSFAGGIILGIVALNAKSFFPAFVLHWAASVGFDIMVVAARPH